MNHRDPEHDDMLMNWPERVWIYSPLRPLFQKREVRKWQRLTGPVVTETALEIGCGLGRGAVILAERMGFRWVAAFDLEERLVHRANRWLPHRVADRISFFAGDAQDLPFRDEKFDAVVNFGIIHHVLDWRRCIREIARVIRPGGMFYFEEIYPPLYANFLMRHLVRHPTRDRFAGPQFLEALATSGFRLLEGVCTKSRFGIVGAARRISHESAGRTDNTQKGDDTNA
jgi:ubiquinone/menaquinone biosynthesis C-methylase UbiE